MIHERKQLLDQRSSHLGSLAVRNGEVRGDYSAAERIFQLFMRGDRRVRVASW